MLSKDKKLRHDELIIYLSLLCSLILGVVLFRTPLVTFGVMLVLTFAMFIPAIIWRVREDMKK